MWGDDDADKEGNIDVVDLYEGLQSSSAKTKVCVEDAEWLGETMIEVEDEVAEVYEADFVRRLKYMLVDQLPNFKRQIHKAVPLPRSAVER